MKVEKSTLYIYIVNRFNSISVFNSHSLGMQCMYVSFIMVWNYYFISARWLPPLRINKVKVKVKVAMGHVHSRHEKSPTPAC